MSMSKSEAGKLGGLASIEASHKAKEERERIYLASPKYCKRCNILLSYKEKHKIFCSHSCSAVYTQAKREKRQTFCLVCSKSIENDRKHCSYRCSKVSIYLKKVEDGTLGTRGLKKYLTEKFGYKCSVCNLTEWNGKSIVLELEHKDGHSENNSYENLCLICPNCHSQTSTYKAKNKGNGRHIRRIRYAENKSY